MTLRAKIGLTLVLAVAAVVVANEARAPEPLSAREPVRASKTEWADVATRVCLGMLARYAAVPPGHWDPLANEANGAPLRRVAVLRREIAAIYRDGLGQISGFGAPPRSAPAQALARLERTLDVYQDAIDAAARGDRRAYLRHRLRMALAIQATREAFERAGADRACSFAI